MGATFRHTDREIQSSFQLYSTLSYNALQFFAFFVPLLVRRVYEKHRNDSTILDLLRGHPARLAQRSVNVLGRKLAVLDGNHGQILTF